MATTLPDYLNSSVPNPAEKRAPWYKNTFPSYAGVFLWFAFYLQIAVSTLSQASVAVCLAGIVVAGLLCFGLYYYAPGMLGMQTGRPLYVVGSSTFGTTGGYLMPGLLMGLLQIGWFAVSTYFATDYIIKGLIQLKILNQPSSTLFTIIAIAWAYGLALLALKGIAYVAKIAQFLNWVPLIMILVVFWANMGGISSYQPPKDDALGGFLTMLAVIIGFFATAGVPLLSVAGYLGGHPGATDYTYTAAITSAGSLGTVAFFLFAIASMIPTCFCTFIASNSFGTMLPKIPKTYSTLVGVTIGAILAVTGVAANLIGFFTIVGASFGPICGAMAADFLLAGASGFVVGILDKVPGVPASLVSLDRPAVLWSFVVGFVVYFALAGIRPPVVAMK